MDIADIGETWILSIFFCYFSWFLTFSIERSLFEIDLHKIWLTFFSLLRRSLSNMVYSTIPYSILRVFPFLTKVEMKLYDYKTKHKRNCYFLITLVAVDQTALFFSFNIAAAIVSTSTTLELMLVIDYDTAILCDLISYGQWYC